MCHTSLLFELLPSNPRASAIKSKSLWKACLWAWASTWEGREMYVQYKPLSAEIGGWPETFGLSWNGQVGASMMR